MSGLFAAPLLATVLLGPAEQAAEAEGVAARAVALHSDGKLEEASEALAQAYAIYPDRDYLYMRGIIERQAGDCDTAVQLFSAFLAENPPLVDVEATQAELDKCAATLPQPEAQPTPPPEPRTLPPAVVDPEAVLADDVRAPVDETPRPRRWWQDPAGGALVGSGLVLAAVGGGLAGGAAARARAAERAPTAGEYRDGISAASGMSTGGWVLVGVGTSLVVGGHLRWAVLARRSAR